MEKVALVIRKLWTRESPVSPLWSKRFNVIRTYCNLKPCDAAENAPNSVRHSMEPARVRQLAQRKERITASSTSCTRFPGRNNGVEPALRLINRRVTRNRRNLQPSASASQSVYLRFINVNRFAANFHRYRASFLSAIQIGYCTLPCASAAPSLNDLGACSPSRQYAASCILYQPRSSAT